MVGFSGCNFRRRSSLGEFVQELLLFCLGNESTSESKSLARDFFPALELFELNLFLLTAPKYKLLLFVVEDLRESLVAGVLPDLPDGLPRIFSYVENFANWSLANSERLEGNCRSVEACGIAKTALQVN